MFKTKVYLYDSSQEENGYRGQDFSQYVLQGDELTEDITQEMDINEITLCGLSKKDAFLPQTKFIIDFVETDGENETILATEHRVVSEDMPIQPIISDDEYFDHHISLIEPSVVAQQRLVDNISVTYKLKDVSLQELPAIPDNNQTLVVESSSYTPTRNFGSQSYIYVGATYFRYYYGKYFDFEGQIEMLNSSDTSFSLEYENIADFQVGNQYFAKFKLPKVAIYGGVTNTKTFTKIGYASIDYVIEEFSLTDTYNPLRRISGSFISNSNLNNGSVYSPVISGVGREEWIAEGRESHIEAGSRVYTTGVRKYTETSVTAPTYITDLIEIFPDRNYKITISLHEFSDNVPSGINLSKWTNPPTLSFYYDTGDITNQVGTAVYTTTNQTSGFTGFVTYSLDTLRTIVYSSSTPYSALALLQKAIINSSIYEKEDGVYIADVNNSKLPFYVDENFIDELSSTVIIENFYNQKNLWEIMIDVGHYIHAIPELVFGSDDRFKITFNRLGITNESVDKSNKVSIYNSRSVENYISATSSYISNMVQLGGYIEEWVSPKTTDDTLLVSNDTAEIIASKPIIELLQLIVKNNNTNQTADMTQFIYEKNVYDTLQLDYQINPNRGIAMYYSLGDNIITGGQFKLPQAVDNIYTDYTIKKIIYCAFNSYPVISSPIPETGYWSDIKVNDYSFFIKYRTKDSVRQNHIRPDIRKYLLNSKYDRIPEHNQFNNQTDVVVDSLKFGNNVYGKLIKTGNNSYEIVEWNDKYENVKHKGELYRINGELYYVAKITHYRYSSYILSKITYSKDYNELSVVIGIPSEPRFYEISEQSLIWREFAINDILLLTDDKSQLQYKSNYLFNYNHVADLILGEGTDFAKYAITVYKGDKDIDSYDQTMGQSTLYTEVINPINAYSSENTLTYEWDMIDNYSAGDKVINVDENESVSFNERAYTSLRAVGYTDIYGKAALLDFYILGSIGTLSKTEIMALPESPIKTKDNDITDTRTFVGDLDILASNVKEYDENFNGRGIGLLKDCREALSINFNLQLATNSDTFVLSPYIYLPNKQNIKVVLLSEEVNKLSNGYINNSEIITPIDTHGDPMNQYFNLSVTKETTPNTWDTSSDVVYDFGIDFSTIFEDVADGHFTDDPNYTRVKSIAILCDVSLNTGDGTGVSVIPYKTQFILARNIPSDWTRQKALSTIWFGSPNKNQIFKQKQ